MSETGVLRRGALYMCDPPTASTPIERTKGCRGTPGHLSDSLGALLNVCLPVHDRVRHRINEKNLLVSRILLKITTCKYIQIYTDLCVEADHCITLKQYIKPNLNDHTNLSLKILLKW